MSSSSSRRPVGLSSVGAKGMGRMSREERERERHRMISKDEMGSKFYHMRPTLAALCKFKPFLFIFYIIVTF